MQLFVVYGIIKQTMMIPRRRKDEKNNMGSNYATHIIRKKEMIAELQKILAPEKEVIVPVSARVKTGRTVYNKASDTQETEYIYKHLHWKKIISIEIKTEILRSVK